MLALINLPFTSRSINTLIIFSVLLITVISCSTKSSPSYQLTTSSVPSEGGSVNPVSGEFDEDEEVQIKADANENWVFDGWEGDQTGSQNPMTVTMDSDKSITARFVKRQYPLTINVQGEGSVSESIVQNKMTDYDHGTVVELQANSNMGYNFTRWEGAVESTDNPIQITVDGPKEVTVVFEISKFAVEVRAEGPGDVSIDPDKDMYEYNETVQFEAVPDPGNEFLGWFNESGSFEMLVAQFEYQITENLDIAAFFNTIEGAFIVETVEIQSADGKVSQVRFNVYNFLLREIELAGAVLLNSEGEEQGMVEFQENPVLEARTGIEVRVNFSGNLVPDEEAIKEWLFTWLFDVDGERYEKEQEVGEPSGNAKQKPDSFRDINIQKSFQLNIR